MQQITRRETPVAVWLTLVCVLVYAMILVGGATRLTDSGLSITEWKPISGVIPPLNAHDWQALFAKYQQTTEYQEQNRGMSLGDFQWLYWWEWGHRLLGRVIGLVVALGVAVFWATGRLKGRVGASLVLFALIGIEGVIGWWMVTSGLFSALDVSPLRLAIHLGAALLILGFATWLALDAWGWPRERSRLGAPAWLPGVFLATLFAQAMLGALLAGARGGSAYPDWPTIGGHWIPTDAFALTPLARNFLANHATQHLFHRSFGYVVALLALSIAAIGAMRGEGSARKAAIALSGLGLLQSSLGIATVIAGAPLGLSLAHQGGAVALWLAGVFVARATWR